MSGWFEVATSDKGQYSFVLKAANSQVILRSQQYESKASAPARNTPRSGLARPASNR